jgi:hypothetical protein
MAPPLLPIAPLQNLLHMRIAYWLYTGEIQVRRVPTAILRVLANINASVDLDTGQVVEHVTTGG